MKPTLKIAAIVLALTNLISLSQAQTIEKKSLTIDGAKKVIAGAVAYAKKNNAPGGVIAVVDEGGNLMALERLDGTFAAGANISIGKARTAVLFKRPTKATRWCADHDRRTNRWRGRSERRLKRSAGRRTGDGRRERLCWRNENERHDADETCARAVL